jgi:NADH-quinone oxidoreductase subunit G
LLGNFVQEHPQAETINWLIERLAEATTSEWGFMTHGANGAGCRIAGALPKQSACGGKAIPGKNAYQMLSEGLKGYLLFNCEPDMESIIADQALQNLQQADCVIAFTPFADGRIAEYANIMLPIAGPYETSGTYINVEGTWQSFAAAVPAPGEARPGWKILRVLGNLFEFNGYEYEDSRQVIDELHEKFELAGDFHVARKIPEPLVQLDEDLCRRNALPLYMVDGVVRRAPALQQTPKASTHHISVSRVKIR